MTFLPDGTMLVTERVGRLRAIRNGVLDPEPVAGRPAGHLSRHRSGVDGFALHPKFAENRWVYFSYHKPIGNKPREQRRRTRGTWDGTALTEVREIFLSDDVDTEAIADCPSAVTACCM